MHVIDKCIVLVLNKNWMPVGQKSVKDAIRDLCGGSVSAPNALALDMEYDIDVTGEYNFDEPINITPVNWETWCNLPVRDYDLHINTPTHKIRVPTILICQKYNKIPMRRFSPTKHTIWERDRGTCQYTGKNVGRHNANIDHIIPVSRGGKNTFENMVLCSKEINQMKGDKTPDEIGLKLIRKPVEPAPVPISAYINEIKHFSWKKFLF